MNKKELIDAVSEKADVSKRLAADVVNSALEVVTETLANGERVQIPGFGSFDVAERGARQGRNPQTGEAISIPAVKTPKFHPGLSLREAVKA